ncbi:PTS sugar transporter subunit IIB [Paenibacillus sp. GSMTC-2017]|uniref:PTS sugar transporter subunit IIB n=1 Tax=Paenibacillus sp. GSMTC-2017 TaxID=2794350 RepID=UPI002FBD5266
MSVVCSLGLGTSFLLRLQTEQIFKDHGIPAIIQHIDLMTARSTVSDLYITTINHEFDPLGNKGTVVLIENVLDIDELKGKIDHFLKENNYV